MHENIQEREEVLRQAMLASDVAALDELIRDDLVFTTHTGAVIDKKTDLHAHRAGVLRLSKLQTDDQQIRVYEDTAVVTVRAELAGSYDGVPFTGLFRYTRVWVKQNGRWQIVAGHASTVSQ